MEISERPVTFDSYGHGATVAYGSPKPLIWVRILVPVLINLKTVFIMTKVANYFRDSYKELMEKVTWPTWAQLQQSTMIVLVATLVITALVTLIDFGAGNVLKQVYKMLN